MDNLISLIIVVLFLALFPLGIIWSLNTLFGLTIAYTGKTWFASMIVWAAFASSGSRSSK